MSLSQVKIAVLLIAGFLAVQLSACSSAPPRRPQALPYTSNIALQPPSVIQKVPQNASLSALAVARTLIGTPYRFGGADPNGFDCSGLVQYSFQQAGVNLPRTSRDIFRSSRLIRPADRQPGDLVFFAISKNKISHVGIYSGDNHFIHSPSSGKGVSYASLDSSYWSKRLVGVGRF